MPLLYISLALVGIVVAYILFLVICALAVDPKREYTRHNSFYRAVLDGVTAIGIKIMRIRVHVSGEEKLPVGALPLFVCNHRSSFDPIITWYALKKWKLAFISKPSNFKIPVFGRLIRRCCFLPIDRENPRNAIRTIQAAAGILADGDLSVAVYPEGTRNRQPGLLPFHNGVYKIAQKAGAPIVVLTVSGTEKIHKNYPLHSSHVYLDIVHCFPAQEVCSTKTDLLGQQIRNLMEKSLQEREKLR